VNRSNTSTKKAGRRSRQRWKKASGVAGTRGKSGSRCSRPSAKAWLNALGARRITATQNCTRAVSVHTRCRSVRRTRPNAA
jgi:hypothetical protein